MNSQALVSVIMPAYNHEKYIGEAIDSVLKQSWANLELIIVDDGSTDGTAEIVKAYKDSRLLYFYQDNQDAYNALNNAMEKTKGDFISIINSDDAYTNKRIERLVTLLQQSDAHAVFSDVQAVDANSTALNDPDFGWNQWHQANRNFFLDMPDDLYRGFLHGNLMVTTSNLIISRQAYKRVGNFSNLRYLHDYDYIFRLLRAYPNQVRYLEKEKLIHYRIHGDNTIAQAAITGREQDIQIIREAVVSQCPNESRLHVNAGIDRLLTLQKELQAVHALLEKEKEPPLSVQQQLANIRTQDLFRVVIERLKSKILK